jgi:hypothetical protein
MGEERMHTVSVGYPEGKRPLGKPRRSWKNEINMDLGRLDGRVRSGFTWLKVVMDAGLL